MFSDYIDDVDNYSSHPETYLDVPFVPSDEDVVQAMLNLARVGSQDVLYDLGCGDGRIVITAARERNARGIGIDIDPVRIADAMEEAGYAGVERLVDFLEENIFEVEIREATVVTLYLLQSVNVQLRPRLLSTLQPGTRVISHAFDMGDWKADDWIKLAGINIYKWIVPAQISGEWSWDDHEGRSYKVDLQQRYQEVRGRAWINGKLADIVSAELCGKRLELVIRDSDTRLKVKHVLVFENGEISSVTSRNLNTDTP